MTNAAVGVLGSIAAGAVAGLALVGGLLGGLLSDSVISWFETHPLTPEQSDAMLRSML